MSKFQEKANEIAQEHGFDYARYVQDFEDKEVYEPMYRNCNYACVGLPISIVVNENNEEYLSGQKGLDFYIQLPNIQESEDEEYDETETMSNQKNKLFDDCNDIEDFKK